MAGGCGWPNRTLFLVIALAICGAELCLTGLCRAQGYPAGAAGTFPAMPAEERVANLPGITVTPPPTAGPSAPRQIVVDVQITGNEATKDYDIQKSIQTRKEREFDPELVQADVRRLVQTGKFRDVKTFTRQASGGVIVIYEVFERPRVNYIRMLGNRGLSEKKLTKEHGLKVGDPLNSYSSEEARRKLEDLYHKEGFPSATVTLLEGDQKDDKGVIFVINEGQLERIAWVTFEGNTIASDSRLNTQIESKPGYFWYLFRGKVDRAKIDADVEKLTIYYRNLGYFRARVGRELAFDESGKWLHLKFIIDEGPRYVVRNVTVEGNTKFASRPLMDMLKLQSGDYFTQAYMNRDLALITDLYGSQGHVFADVQADPRFLEEPGQIDLVYRIQEGDVFRVGEINVNIAGEFPHTRQTVVLNRLSLRPGDIIDNREVRNSERRLRASQLFTTNPQEGEPPRVNVRPPDFSSLGGLSYASPPPETVRGQSPEESKYTQPTSDPQVSPNLRTGTSRFSWEGPRGP